jgi:hypothetical protein
MGQHHRTAAQLLDAGSVVSQRSPPSLAEGGLMRPDVVFTVIFLKDGKHLASPTVLSEFGHEVRVEFPNEMRALVLADAPNQDGRSFTSAKMAIFQDGVWQPPYEMTMEAYLSMTPSFEYSVAGTPYRFVVMPRRILPAANEEGL